MAERSAGILAYREDVDGGLEVLLVHPGGPYWRHRDREAWSLPKGEHGTEEDPLEAARREFAEELGVELRLPQGAFIPLGTVRQKGGKRVRAWAVETDLEVEAVRSNTFRMEWPPRSGRTQDFPEVDRAGWFSPERAREMLLPAQVPFVDRLLETLRS